MKSLGYTFGGCSGYYNSGNWPIYFWKGQVGALESLTILSLEDLEFFVISHPDNSEKMEIKND